jgi:hypothetical protein
MGIHLSFWKAEKKIGQNSEKSFSMIKGGWNLILGVDINDGEASV